MWAITKNAAREAVRDYFEPLRNRWFWITAVATVAAILGTRPAPGAEPAFVVTNKCAPQFVVTNRIPAPVPADRFRGSDGVLYERHPDGIYRAVLGAPVEICPSPFG